MGGIIGTADGVGAALAYGSLAVVLFLWVGVGGGIGAAIGSSKGKGGLGFVLGLFLGFIGWIIAAFLSRSPQKEAEFQRSVSYALHGHPGVPPRSHGQRPEPQRWAPDPYARHGHRLHDGEQWTSVVADNGVQSNDPPGYGVPSEPSEG
jgi:hypothetical protein